MVQMSQHRSVAVPWIVAAVACGMVVWMVCDEKPSVSMFNVMSVQQKRSLPPLIPSTATDPILVRCFWENHQTPLPFSSCPSEMCAGSVSHQAYGQFLFHQAVSAATYYKPGQQTKTLQKFLDQPAQCLFLPHHDQSLTTMCSCTYSTFEDYCHRVLYNPHVRITYRGDSTTSHWRDAAKKTCEEYVTPRHHNRTTHTSETRKSTSICVVNDKTLHSLYLPFYRETDIPAKSGFDKWLNNSPSSLQHFLNNIQIILQRQIEENDNVLVYMANNHVCQDHYTENYALARDFLNQPDADRLQQVQERRHVDTVATWGLTLDFYGSRLAQQLAQQLVTSQFPDVLYMGLDAEYPGACALSRDGRHFWLPGEAVKGLNYYTAKTRILMHLVESRLPKEEDA